MAPAPPKAFLTSTSWMAWSAWAMSRQIKTPLPRARPSALTAQRPPSEAANREAAGESAKVPARAVGMPCCSMKMLREDFGGLELGGFLVRPPDAQAVLPEQIHDAQRQRIVRPDDGEVGAVLPGEGAQAGQVFGAELDALDRRAVLCEAFLRDAGIAGRAPQSGDVRRLRQLPDQRVLAAAGADNQDLHGRN